MSSFGYRYNEVVGPLSIAPAGGVTRGAKSMNPEAGKVKQTMVIGSHYIAVYVVKSKKDEALIETIKSSAKVIRLSFSMIQSLIARGIQGTEYQQGMLHKVLASIKARAEECGEWLIDQTLNEEYKEKLKKVEATSLGRHTKHKAYKDLARSYDSQMLKRFDGSNPAPSGSTSTAIDTTTASLLKQRSLADYLKSA